ncbi:DUF2628 domain-containing protein [Paenibacillus lentus]|uniref:DUF2628 domain-containing protein n=1 Tax=Paenibacillus lentus TaxID=1338368 RepID=UPI001FEC7829|nr:DUF2628 domain-containing protein [Paenibacillus lentus]
MPPQPSQAPASGPPPVPSMPGPSPVPSSAPSYMPPPYGTYQQYSEDELTHLLRLHTNNDKYFEKVMRKSKWNWPIFLFGPIWLGYRKMYAECAMYVGTLSLISIFLMFLGSESSGGFAGVGIGMAILANQIYYKKSKKVIDQIMQSHNDPEVRRNLAIQKGGTSGWGIVYAIVIFIVSVIIEYLIEDTLL